MRYYSIRTMHTAVILLVLLATCIAFANAQGTELPLYSNDAVGECLPSVKDHSHFHCFPAPKQRQQHNSTTNTTTPSSTTCTDEHPECSFWAKKGECDKNPRYMQTSCRKSCDTCLDGHGGITQIAPRGRHEQVMQRVRETAVYLQQYYNVSTNSIHCRNKHEMCTFWAVRDECSTNREWMQKNCAAACRTCS